MKPPRGLAILILALLLASASVQAQAPLFNMTFRGTLYQTNGVGQVVTTAISETNLLLAAALAGGTSDISQMALVYHIMGDTGHGDTIEVWNKSSRQFLTTMFGLYFADNFPDNLGRTALTNNVGTQQRRVDYVYMFNLTDLTYPNSHSMGASFTTKRFSKDLSGNVHTSINGEMQWIVNPNGGAGTKIINGSFTTKTPF
jgi:hypothetical protein